MTTGVFDKSRVRRGPLSMGSELCPRCGGLLNWQWNVALHQEELHCVACGNLPNQHAVRADGQASGATRLCKDCRIRPVVKIGRMDTFSEKESERCAGCRMRWNAKRRMRERMRIPGQLRIATSKEAYW